MPPRYFIYARKSTEDESRQILSIEGQLTELKKIAERDRLAIIDIFIESKSAHIPNNRPKFNEMIKRIKNGEANGIITWHINRISRNPKESGEIQQMLQDHQIISIIVPHKHYKSEDNALFFSLETSEANQYSRDLSVNVKRGLRQKYALGHPPSIAPLGYLNTKINIRGANQIVEDPERWLIVRKGFEMMLSGAYTVSNVLDTLNNEYGLRTKMGTVRGGKSLSKSGLYRILINPFYYGYFIVKGAKYKGAYKPMITIDEYDRIQSILGRDDRPRSKKHEFDFTGLIKCGVCGSSITASKKEKRLASGEFKTYILYHCTRRKKAGLSCTERYFLSAQYIENLIVTELTKYEIEPGIKEWAIITAQENFKDEVVKYEEIQKSLIVNELKIKKELSNLVDLRIASGISEEMYFEKKAEKEKLLHHLVVQMNALKEESINWIKRLEHHLNFTTNIIQRFKKGNSATKKEICHDFGWNWILKDKQLLVDKADWLEPIRNCKKDVDAVISRFGPINTLTKFERNPYYEALRPILCDLINEVRNMSNILKDSEQ